MQHLTTTKSAEIVFKQLAPGAVITLPDLSHCKKLESLQLSGELVYYRSWHEKIEVYGYPESLDLTALASSKVKYLNLYKLGECKVEQGDGVETIVYSGTVPDTDALSKLPNLKEIQLLLSDTYDLTPLASSESLHLLQFGLTPNTKYTKSYPKWDLSPLKDSNVDTLVFGSDLSIKMLESIEGAENIRHLQLSRTDLMKNIGYIGSFPNLETVAVIAEYDRVDTWISNKHAIEYIAGEHDKNTADVLHAFADRGGKVVAIKSTNNYYDWYYKNVK